MATRQDLQAARARRPSAEHLVLATMRRLGVTSRADICRKTGLADSTVSQVVAGLMRRDLVEEASFTLAAGHRRSTRSCGRPHESDEPTKDGVITTAPVGRPRTGIRLTRSAGLVIGLDLGKRHVRTSVATGGHEVLAEVLSPLPSNSSRHDQVDLMVELTASALAEAGSDMSEVTAAGMGLPGPLIGSTRRSGPSTIVAGWAGCVVADVMTDALGVPVVAENDANLGALAEYRLGAGRSCPNLMFIQLATGVGAGIIANGRLYTGHDGTAGEIGHVQVQPNGRTCICGRSGCLETVIGGERVVNDAGMDLVTLRDLALQAQQGDGPAREAVKRAATELARVLTMQVGFMNPGLIILGGPMALAGDVLLHAVRNALADPRAQFDECHVVLGELADRAVVSGALIVALEASTS